MTESLEKLRQLVADLEDQLDQVSGDNPEAQELLQRLSKDVDQALHEQAPQDFAGETFMDHVKTSAQEFETSHPKIAAMFNQIVDILNQMGI